MELQTLVESENACHAPASVTAQSGNRPSPPLIPIRSLGERHRNQITPHLLGLDERDRYLRFGFIANDEHVIRYVEGLDFERDKVFGITNRKLALIAVAHLAFPPAGSQGNCAEFGVSVAKAARGRGYGARLFERAAMDARNNGASLMFIHALSENSAMLGIARKAGAVLERHGSESEARLRLLPASLNSRMTEIVEEHYAELDYRLKAQSRQLHDVLAAIKTLQCTWPSGKERERD
jgi:GNAT superfamily N-acetyltransferase